MAGNNWDFCLKKIYNVIISVFVNPSSGPSFAWSGTDWDWIPQSRWLAPNRTYWILSMGGSHLWVWLHPGWIGRCLLSLAFTHGFMLSELPEKPSNLPDLKTWWARSVFHWYDYLAALLFPLWELQMLCYEWMLWLILFNGISKILKKLFQLLMLNKYKLERWFYKTDWP